MFFINPAIIYAFVWLAALGLYFLHYSNVLLALSSTTLSYILLSILMPILAWMFFALIRKPFKLTEKVNINTPVSLNAFFKIRMLVMIWSLGTLFTVCYFRTLPILTVFGLGHMTYAQYGIHSLQGFLNAILQSLSIYALYLFISTKNKKYLWLFLVTFAFPFLTLNRGMLTSMMLQSLFVILVFRKIKLKTFIKIVIFAISFLFLFGFMGVFRYMAANVHNSHLYSIFEISANYPNWLPKSFIWVYIYITTPLNNINNIIHQFPTFAFHPYAMIYSAIPTFIRNMLAVPIHVHLINSAFNVSSYMPDLLLAYGYVGSLIFYFFASLVPIYFFYKFLLTKRLRYGFILVIFLHSIVLSVFSDFFFLQVYIFQVLLQYFVFSSGHD